MANNDKITICLLKKFFSLVKFFAQKILKTLNKVDPHWVHIMRKNHVNISIGLAVRASLSINNSLILVL